MLEAPTSTTTAGARPEETRRPAASRRDRLLIVLLAAVVVFLILQITMGGVVRVTGSGLGCPDWPLCHGRIIPPADYHAWIEWTHRTVGSVAGVVVIASVARAWLRSRDDRVVLWLSSATLGLIAVVGGFGASVVLTELSPVLRTVHLALAEATLAVATWALAVATGAFGARTVNGAESGHDRPVLDLAWIGAVSVLIALLAGSYAVWRDAGTICVSWPLCGGAVIPTNVLAWTHMVHRVLAGASSLVLALAAHRAFRLPAASAALRWTALGALALVVVQVLVGAANPWTQFQEWARALHLSLGTMVWADAALMAILVTMRSVRPAAATGASVG